MRFYKERSCDICGAKYLPTGGRNFWCSVMCRVLDSCDVSSDCDACWPWNRSFDKNGYGEIRIFGGRKFAHRVVFEVFTGIVLTRAEVVLHSCDNPSCCNPFHLEAGSQADNVRDMLQKGRGQDYSLTPKGERHGRSTICDQVALDIFHAAGKLNDIAHSFNVSRDIVEKIKYGFCWNHVTGKPKKRKPRRKLLC